MAVDRLGGRYYYVDPVGLVDFHFDCCALIDFLVDRVAKLGLMDVVIDPFVRYHERIDCLDLNFGLLGANRAMTGVFDCSIGLVGLLMTASDQIDLRRRAFDQTR